MVALTVDGQLFFPFLKVDDFNRQLKNFTDSNGQRLLSENLAQKLSKY